MSRQRVVVTGMGVVSALGFDEQSVWEALLAGRTGIGKIASFDTAGLKTTVGSEVDSAALAVALKAAGLSPFDRTVDMGMLATAQALGQAGLLPSQPPYPPRDMPVILGSGAGSAMSLFESFKGYFASGPRGVRPTSVPRGMGNALSSQISLHFRLTGPNYVTVSACTSATTAIGIAFRMIRDGYATAVLCGGADTAFSPALFTGWNNLGVMSRNSDPAAACRPFDAARDGCVLGEGAAVFVLESLESAAARGARIRAELAGYGESSDAQHITRPSAEGQARAIRAALECAGVQPLDIGFINAHGTGTASNDECECQSIRLALGDAADAIPIASNKSFFGHLLGACGAIETFVAILGLENRLVPPNLNLDSPDPKCLARFVGRTPEAIAAPFAMKNSFGFGGNNTVLVLRRGEK